MNVTMAVVLKYAIFVASSFTAAIYLENWPLSLILSIILLIILERKCRFFIIALKTLPRDLRIVTAYFQYVYQMEAWKLKKWTTAQVFLENVKKHPKKYAFIHEESKWTFQQVEDFSNQVANFFKSQGFKRGDTIALFMEGRPEYVCLWLGLSKIGVVSAFVNTQQRQNQLLHSFNIVDCKAVVIENKLKSHFDEISCSVPHLKIYSTGKPTVISLLQESVDLDEELSKASTAPLLDDISLTKMTDILCYIYTSGTTGLPKAAIMTHFRFMFMTCSSFRVLSLMKNDVLYEPLPLYHAAGGLLGVGQAILNGLTVVIKTKFSASNFWNDCIKHNCTMAHYIGELCRYLLAQPEKSVDRQHKVHLMVGNGLRPEIWEKFVKRFNIKQIAELYAATEGNANMINADNKVGAVGYIPWFCVLFYPVTLIRIDSETNEPILGEDGFCIRCKPDEPGILIGKICDQRPSSQFNGYSDKKSSEKKIIYDVFKKGDKFFNSGDVLVRDEYGYFYFRDRIGDTYRWHGENVATLEVEAIISNVVGLKDCVVYGVEIANTEGKAGMAALVDENKQLNLEAFQEGIKHSLQSFARPLFLRVIDHVPITGTFKLKKTHLQSEGYNPSIISDPLFFLDSKKGAYVQLTNDIYQEIINGKVRL